MADQEAGQKCEYDPSILHEPVDVDPDGPIPKVKALLEKKLKLSLKDGRTVEGNFAAFDKFANFVITTATERFRTQTRQIPMVIVPLDYALGVEVLEEPAEPAEPAVPEEPS
jgi:small nuclear ribonucleoprotein (snRNP)-like protein